MNGRCHSHTIRQCDCAALAAALLLTTAQPSAAQPGTALSHGKISETEGGFGGMLDDGDFVGVWAASLGDLDGDGVPCGMNCDGEAKAFDIEPFIECLLMQPCGDRCDAIAKVNSARKEQIGGPMRHT